MVRVKENRTRSKRTEQDQMDCHSLLRAEGTNIRYAAQKSGSLTQTIVGSGRAACRQCNSKICGHHESTDSSQPTASQRPAVNLVTVLVQTPFHILLRSCCGTVEAYLQLPVGSPPSSCDRVTPYHIRDTILLAPRTALLAPLVAGDSEAPYSASPTPSPHHLRVDASPTRQRFPCASTRRRVVCASSAACEGAQVTDHPSMLPRPIDASSPPSSPRLCFSTHQTL
jgi:hypothetical protein